MADDHYQEKRDFIRMRVDTQVTYTLNGESDSIHHGTSIDLSATGLYMVTDYAPKVNDNVDILMNPNSERLPPFSATGKVTRCTADNDNKNLYHVSIELMHSS
ncbi:MAG: PilZ domain-containing protein [Methylophagaceae bacterium]